MTEMEMEDMLEMQARESEARSAMLDDFYSEMENVSERRVPLVKPPEFEPEFDEYEAADGEDPEWNYSDCLEEGSLYGHATGLRILQMVAAVLSTKRVYRYSFDFCEPEKEG